MRALFFILVVFSFSAAAQTPAMKKSFDEGIEFAKDGDYQTAAERFRRVLLAAEIEKPLDEFLSKVHYNLGVCFYRLKKIEKSVSEFSEAIKLSRRAYGQAFYALGMAQNDLKNYDKAENAFRESLKLNNLDGEAWFDLGLVFLRKAKFERAENAFENAVKFRSVAAPDALNNLGVIAALRHEFDSAEKYFAAALEASNDQSKTARDNLEFCRFYRRKNQPENLTAKLEFSKR